MNYITGQIRERQRVFILVASRGSEHFDDQSIDASNLSPPRGWIDIVSLRPSSTFNGLARHDRVVRGLIICRSGRPIVTYIVLLCAVLFYDNDTTHTTRCDVSYDDYFDQNVREQPLATQRTDPHRIFEAVPYIQ